MFNNVYLELTKHPVEGFSAGLIDDSNVFEVWNKTITMLLVRGRPQ